MAISIDLHEFCDREPEGRYGLPWVVRGKTYATDGRVAIRMNEPSEGCIPDEEQSPKHRRPNIDSILKDIEKVTEWLPPPVSTECDECGNAYFFEDKCSNCIGAGLCLCGCCNKEHDCGWCDGEGVVEEVCECTTMFQDRMLLNRYSDKIKKLPAVKCGVAESGQDRIVFFTFHGGVGAVMPVVARSTAKPDLGRVAGG